MFKITPKIRRKLNKRKLRCIRMITKITNNEYTEEYNSKQVLLKHYGNEIENINRKLFISKYCF